MTDTDDLVSWLRARLDADENDAEMGHSADCPLHLPGLSDDQLYEPTDPDRCTCRSGRWLRDIAAKRAILDLREAWAFAANPAPSADLAVRFADQVHAADMIIRLLAAVYADRPGYQDQWKP